MFGPRNSRTGFPETRHCEGHPLTNLEASFETEGIQDGEHLTAVGAASANECNS